MALAILSYYTDGKPANQIGMNKGRRMALSIYDDKKGVMLCSLPAHLNDGKIPALREARGIIEGRGINMRAEGVTVRYGSSAGENGTLVDVDEVIDHGGVVGHVFAACNPNANNRVMYKAQSLGGEFVTWRQDHGAAVRALVAAMRKPAAPAVEPATVNDDRRQVEASFTLNLRVDNPALLLAAAQAHPDGEGIALVDEEGMVDISACLRILLDPGSLPGCSIHDHEAECFDLHDLSEGDDHDE